jgi:hypothetical protein
MDYYETVMTHYLRSDRVIFVNTEMVNAPDLK